MEKKLQQIETKRQKQDLKQITKWPKGSIKGLRSTAIRGKWLHRWNKNLLKRYVKLIIIMIKSFW